MMRKFTVIFSLSLITTCFAATDSTQLGGVAEEAQDQYLKVDNSTPAQVSTHFSNGNATDLKCPAGYQLLGVSESNTGSSLPISDTDKPHNWHASGNYAYIPVCDKFNGFTDVCSKRTWIQMYAYLDSLQITCVPNTLAWQPSNPANPGYHLNPPNETIQR